MYPNPNPNSKFSLLNESQLLLLTHPAQRDLQKDNLQSHHRFRNQCPQKFQVYYVEPRSDSNPAEIVLSLRTTQCPSFSKQSTLLLLAIRFPKPYAPTKLPVWALLLQCAVCNSNMLVYRTLASPKRYSPTASLSPLTFCSVHVEASDIETVRKIKLLGMLHCQLRKLSSCSK